MKNRFIGDCFGLQILLFKIQLKIPVVKRCEQAGSCLNDLKVIITQTQYLLY
jgi:hypothetical protein